MLASAGIPGAFPFREIDGSLYVDGGVTGNILYGGRVREEQSFPALWATAYLAPPGADDPLLGHLNNQLRPLPQVTAPTWPAGHAQPRNGYARGHAHVHAAPVCAGGDLAADARRDD